MGACVSFFFGALALYAAAQLVMSVWEVLVVIALVTASASWAVWWWRNRSPW